MRACVCVCVCVPSECYLRVVGDGQRLLAAKVLFASLEFFVLSLGRRLMASLYIRQSCAPVEVL